MKYLGTKIMSLRGELLLQLFDFFCLSIISGSIAVGNLKREGLRVYTDRESVIPTCCLSAA